eukprot:3391966-Prymnesium_polylepis.1
MIDCVVSPSMFSGNLRRRILCIQKLYAPDLTDTRPHVLGATVQSVDRTVPTTVQSVPLIVFIQYRGRARPPSRRVGRTD